MTEAPASGYGAPSDEGSADGSGEGSGLTGYEETTLAPAADEYLPPAEEARRRGARRQGGRRRAGKGKGRRQGRQQGRRVQGKRVQGRRPAQNQRRPASRG